MEHSDTLIELAERIAVLETKQTMVSDKLDSVDSKLDDLLHLKSKGTGAIQLAGLILGSGVIGFIVMIVNFFSPKPHL